MTTPIFALHAQRISFRWRDKVRDAYARLYFVLFESDGLFFELTTGVGAVAWGLWLLLPVKTFESNTGYAALVIVGNFIVSRLHLVGFEAEDVWGLWVLCWGMAQVASLLLRERRLRRWSSLWLALTWFWVAAAFWWANPRASASWYPVIAMGELWVRVRNHD